MISALWVTVMTHFCWDPPPPTPTRHLPAQPCRLGGNSLGHGSPFGEIRKVSSTLPPSATEFPLPMHPTPPEPAPLQLPSSLSCCPKGSLLQLLPLLCLSPPVSLCSPKRLSLSVGSRFRLFEAEYAVHRLAAVARGAPVLLPFSRLARCPLPLDCLRAAVASPGLPPAPGPSAAVHGGRSPHHDGCVGSARSARRHCRAPTVRRRARVVRDRDRPPSVRRRVSLPDLLPFHLRGVPGAGDRHERRPRLSFELCALPARGAGRGRLLLLQLGVRSGGADPLSLLLSPGDAAVQGVRHDGFVRRQPDGDHGLLAAA